MESVAKKVRVLLKEKPFLEDIVLSDIANLSKVTKNIQKEIGEGGFHAVHAALRRYVRERAVRSEDIQKKVLGVLKNSKISVRSKLVSACFKRDLFVFEKIRSIERNVKREDGEIFNVIESELFITLLLDQKNSKFLKPFEKFVLKVSENLGAVIIVSPEIVEKTVGFIAFVTSVLARNNVNIIDFIFSYTNTIILVAMPDVPQTFGILSKYV